MHTYQLWYRGAGGSHLKEKEHMVEFLQHVPFAWNTHLLE